MSRTREPGIPTQRAPSGLVYVVVDAVGVGDEPITERRETVVDSRELGRAGVDGLASQRQGIALVPVRHLELRQLVMREVGVKTQLVGRGQSLARGSGGRAGRPDYQSGKPFRPILFNVVVNKVGLLAVEVLERQPNPGSGMNLSHASVDVLQEGQDQLGRVVARIAAREEEAGEAHFESWKNSSQRSSISARCVALVSLKSAGTHAQ